MNYLILFLVSVLFASVSMSQEEMDMANQKMEKVNGLSFVASSSPFAIGELEILKQTNASHVAIMPFGFLPSLKSTEIMFDHERQWWGERTEGCKETIKLCSERNFKIMLKPQLWVGGGDFTGHIEMSRDKDWRALESSYSKFILHFAKVAEENKVETFCIGTELGRFVAARPAFWSELITKTREIYSGKITYAENWDCFDKPTFLSELDFIGVDAYFPLTDEKEPTLIEIREGWKPHIEKLKSASEKHNKPILFTECGYRSIDFAGAKPWEYDKKEADVNEELQNRLIQVMFELWDEDWMSGGFLWKWFPYHNRAGGPKNDQFTPQNKIAEKTIIDFYKK